MQSEVPPAVQSEAEQVTEALFSFDFDPSVLAYHLSALALAFVLALPVGWDREQMRSSPGLRTFPLVSMSSCAYVLVAMTIATDGSAQVRMLQGLATGIGFIGGGAILKNEDRVIGTATAAAVWTMGAMGAAVGFRRLEIAILLSIVTLATLRWLKPFKSKETDEA